ncbi:MAG: sugar ABC transporter permease [Spirochaetota bacterium]
MKKNLWVLDCALKDFFVKRKNVSLKVPRPEKRRLSNLSTASICLLPGTIIFGTFNIFPIIYSGYLSLLTWDGLSTQREFAGFSNYAQLFVSGEFWNSILVTLYYMAGLTALSIITGLLIALALNEKVKGRLFFRTLYFIPVVTSTIAGAIVWRYLFDPGSGFINIFLRSFGLRGPGWLNSSLWAMPTVISLGVWKRLGFNMIIYLAGLQSISKEYYEAAKVDGAGRMARFTRITLPLLTPITSMLVIMSVIDSFLVFDQIFVMTSGGPLKSTDVIGFLLYRFAFRYFKLGFASAVGCLIFILIFIITIFQRKFLRLNGETY